MEIKFLNTVQIFKGQQKDSVKDNTSKPSEAGAESKLADELTYKAELAKSQINFRSSKGFNLNKKDLLFLSTLTSAFGLSISYLDKAKQVLSDFLSGNNFKSMNDLAGKNYTAEHVELADKLRTAMELEDNKTNDKLSFILDMLNERCEAGDNYFPESYNYKEAEKIKNEERALIKKGIARYVQREKDNDRKLIDVLSTTFGLNDSEQVRLKEIIDSFLNENKAVSLKQFGGIDYAEDIAILAGNISQEFNLNEYENLLISSEIINRIMSGSKYIARLNPLDRNEEISQRDKAVFMEILSNYNIDMRTQEILYLAMKDDAYKNGYNSIFELFNKENEIGKFTATNSILDSFKLSRYKTDLLIDFHIALKNSETIHEKHRAKEYAASARYTKQSAIICLIAKQYDLTSSGIEKLINYFKTQNLDYSKANDRWKAAYDISDLLNINGKQVNSIINKTNSMEEDELDEYNFKLSRLIMKNLAES